MNRLAVPLFAAALLAACSSSSDSNDSAAVPADGGTESTPLVCKAGERAEGDACVEAGLPTCAAGFRKDGVGCVASLPATCKAGTARILGSEACTVIGDAKCAPGTTATADGWGCTAAEVKACTGNTHAAYGATACVPLATCTTSAPAGTTLFVDDSYAGGQLDATHFATVTAALAASNATSRIFVAAGRYTESIVVPAGVRITGACAGDVVIASPAAATDPVVRFSGNGATLTGVTLEGGAVAVDVGRFAATLEAVAIEGPTAKGISISNGTLTAKHVAIRDAGDGATEAVAVQALGGKVTLTDVSVATTRGSGLSLRRGVDVTLSRVAVRDTTANDSGDYGWGVDVESASHVSGSEVAVRGATFAALAATDTGTTVELDHVVLSDVKTGRAGSGSPRLAVALAATESAKVKLSHATLARTAGAGALVVGASDVTLSDVTVTDSNNDGVASGGIFAAGATAKLERTVISDSLPTGIEVDEGATVTFATTLVTATKSSGRPSEGIGVLAAGGTLTGGALTIEHTRTAQLALIDGAHADLHDVASIDADAGESDNFSGTGIGLLLDDASDAKLDRAFVAGSRFLGVSVRRASKLTAADFVV